MIVLDDRKVGNWVCDRLGGKYFGEGACIGLAKNGDLVAGVTYDMYNGRSACINLASVGGGMWLTRHALKLAFEYPFVQLKLRKLIALVDSTNQDALTFDHRLGFVTEAVIPEAGRYGDLHILTMTPEQCRFIRRG